MANSAVIETYRVGIDEVDSIDIYGMRRSRIEVTSTYTAAYYYYNNGDKHKQPPERNESIDPKPRTILSFLRDYLFTKKDMV